MQNLPVHLVKPHFGRFTPNQQKILNKMELPNSIQEKSLSLFPGKRWPDEQET